MAKELIYPIYLDVPMMTSFLASFEDGFIEETDKEEKKVDADKKKAAGKLQTNFSDVFKIFRANIDAEVSGESNNTLESSYKTKVKYPQAWLFNRLREFLIAEKKLLKIADKSELNSAKVGDIVEFEGNVSPDPNYILRNFFNQILPLVEPSLKSKILEQKILMEEINGMKSKEVKNYGKFKIDGSNKYQMIYGSKRIINEFESNLRMLTFMQETVNSLFPEQISLNNLLIENEGVKIVSKVYKEYARNGTMEDIHQGHWKIIGKVIKKVDSKNIFDFMKDSPFSFLPDSLLSNMLKSMDNEVFKLPKIENKIEEESLVIAPIGIYI